MKLYKSKKICLILLSLSLLAAVFLAISFRASSISFSSEEICSGLSSQESFSFLKTYYYEHQNGEIEENTIRNTYRAVPSEAIETCFFDPVTGETSPPQYYAKDNGSWFFYRYDKDDTWSREKLENFTVKDYLMTSSFSISGVDLQIVNDWKQAGTETLHKQQAVRFDGTCSAEQYLKEKARLNGEVYIEPSAEPDELGTIRVSVWVDEASRQVLQLQYDFSPLTQSGGTDVITVTLWDETAPFEIPEAAEISD